MKTLIIYSTMYGCTKDCANDIKENIGNGSEVISVADAGNIDLSGYDNVVIGSSIAAGSINGKLKKCLTKYHDTLLSKNLHLFLCSGEKSDNFFSTNFNPDLLNHAKQKSFFGGRLRTADLKGFIKFMMKMIGKAADFNSINKEEIKKFSQEIL